MKIDWTYKDSTTVDYDNLKEMMEQMETISITGKNKNGIKVDGYGLQQNELKILLDYITNLQQEKYELERDNKHLNGLLDTALNEQDRLQNENEKLKAQNTRYEVKMNCLIQENDILKENAEHNDKVVDKAKWNETIYKSRCEKAIKYNYELQERYCHSAIRDELIASKIYEITERELNILQNGSDSQ